MQKSYTILFFILVIAIASCKKSYVNDEIQNAPEAIVVEGLVTDVDGQYQVKLSKALGFNTTTESSNTAIGKATVIITEDDTYSEILIEKASGTYETVDLKGKVGHTYKLQITLADGSIYESSSCRMNPPPQIDSIYGEIGSKVKLINEYYTDTIDGINVYADVSSSDESFINFQFRATEEKIIYVKNQPTYYLTGANNNDLPVIKSITKNNITQIKKQYIGFIPRNTLNETNDIVTQEGWLTSCYIFSITEDAYNYYQKMYNQLNGTDRLFDPIPTQLPSNIICKNNSSKIAFGYFKVASVVSKHALFNLNYYDIKVFYKKINNILPYYIKNYKGSAKPAVWVWANIKK